MTGRILLQKWETIVADPKCLKVLQGNLNKAENRRACQHQWAHGQNVLNLSIVTKGDFPTLDRKPSSRNGSRERPAGDSSSAPTGFIFGIHLFGFSGIKSKIVDEVAHWTTSPCIFDNLGMRLWYWCQRTSLNPTWSNPKRRWAFLLATPIQSGQAKLCVPLSTLSAYKRFYSSKAPLPRSSSPAMMFYPHFL